MTTRDAHRPLRCEGLPDFLCWFGHNLADGREVTVDDKKTLSAFVAGNVHVVASEKGRPDDHFDR